MAICDYSTPILRYAEMEVPTSQQETESPSSSSFPGARVLPDNFYTRIGLYYQKCDCSRFISGNCALNQTARKTRLDGLIPMIRVQGANFHEASLLKILATTN